MTDANLAAVLYAKEDVRLEVRPLPTVGDRDVLVEVRSAGVCGSDAHDDGRARAGHPLRPLCGVTPVALQALQRRPLLRDASGRRGVRPLRRDPRGRRVRAPDELSDDAGALLEPFRYANAYTIALAAAGRIELDRLVDARFPPEEADRALRATREDPSLVARVVVAAAPHPRTEGSPRG